LNLQHGWTTEEQRRACFGDGYDAVEYETHRPPNPYDAIQRGEMNDIYDECRELALVGSFG
jgi:hypothetical protein